MNNRLATIVIYALVGYMTTEMGFGWDSFQFWCMLALMWALEQTVKMQLIDDMKIAYDELCEQQDELDKLDNK